MYVYILQCSDNSYYVGVTNNLETRVRQHHAGINLSCYTHDKRPLELVFYELFNDLTSAIAFEKKLKKWSRKKKQALIEKNWSRLQELASCKNESTHKRLLSS